MVVVICVLCFLAKVVFFQLALVGHTADTAAGVAQNAVTQAGNVVNQTDDANNVIYNYEYFHNQYEAIVAAQQNAASFQQQLTSFQASAGPMSQWSWQEQQQYSVLSENLQGMTANIHSLVADYNAKSQMLNRAWLKSKDLPGQLDQEGNPITQ